MDLVLRKRISVKVYKRQSWKDSLLKKITRVSTFILFATPETLRGMGTSFLREDFWDRVGGQALVMIGRWYSRQTLTNQKLPLSTFTIPEIVSPTACTHDVSFTFSGVGNCCSDIKEW